MVEPGMDQSDYILRKMMITDEKGNVQNLLSPPRLERKDNLFRYKLTSQYDKFESLI